MPVRLPAAVFALMLAIGIMAAKTSPSRASTPSPTSADGLTFQVPHAGRLATVHIDFVLLDQGPAANAANLAAAQAAVLARFPGATLPAPGQVAAAYVLNPYSWQSHTASWRYNPAAKPAGLDGDLSALTAAAATWGDAGANFSYTNLGTTSATTGACHDQTDNANTVGWAPQPDAVLAITCAWYDGSAEAEFDMEIDPGWHWTTGPAIDIDLQSVATHEFGHALGLAHSPVAGSVMSANYHAKTDVRALAPDDLAALLAIYGPSPVARGAASGVLAIQPGANLLTWGGHTQDPAQALSGQPGVSAIYSYDTASGTWLRFLPGAPAYVNTLGGLQSGAAYWFLASQAMSLPMEP